MSFTIGVRWSSDGHSDLSAMMAITIASRMSDISHWNDSSLFCQVRQQKLSTRNMRSERAQSMEYRYAITLQWHELWYLFLGWYTIKPLMSSEYHCKLPIKDFDRPIYSTDTYWWYTLPIRQNTLREKLFCAWRTCKANVNTSAMHLPGLAHGKKLFVIWCVIAMRY